jgi:SAM-dependent methyltransferase
VWRSVTTGVQSLISGEDMAFARRDRLIRQRLQDLPAEALVVDIGAGSVRRADWVAKRRYISTDIRALPAVDFASDASQLPLQGHSIDAVLLLEILEHVPDPRGVLQEARRVLKPGGTIILSVPSTVPRHDDSDYWRFTAQGLSQLCGGVFTDGDVHVFGGTFETLAYLIWYYIKLGAHRVGIPVRRLGILMMTIGSWLDRHNSWSTSSRRLHTLAFDLLYVGQASADDSDP